MRQDKQQQNLGRSLYGAVTERIIAELEAGRLPWVQPWDGGKVSCSLPRNGGTGRRYSGINILILWDALDRCGYGSQRWLTFRQCQALGGNVRKGEHGTTVCYADRFTPKGEGDEGDVPGEDRRQIAFLKRFTVFNLDQCEGLPAELVASAEPRLAAEPVPVADALIKASHADVRIGGDRAYYMPSQDYIRVPPQAAFHAPIDWYRTALHELGHWTGHRSRLDRFETANSDRTAYAREELVAEMTSAFTCAELGIKPTVRHSDYIGAWLEVLRGDHRAIFRAASQASKAADYLLAFMPSGETEA